MKLLFFPRYNIKGPSSRYRLYQYQPLLKDFNIKSYPFFGHSYSPTYNYKSFKGVFYLSICYLKRLFNILRLLNKNNICFVQYEFLPYLPFNSLFFRFFKIKYIVDFDDAVFHQYDQSKYFFVRNILCDKIPNVIKESGCVITGSAYLTSFAKKYSSNVKEIPTSIDFKKYNIKENSDKSSEAFVIGWIGSMTTSKNLIALIPAFRTLQKQNVKFKISCIGLNKSISEDFDNLPLEIIEWSSEKEVQDIKNFDVGIMPLEDNLFNKGKCAFKLIQYMACGIPTISTPFTSNINVDRNKENLFASSSEEWVDCFLQVLENRKRFKQIGERNKKVVENYYSIQSNYKDYIEIFKSFTD